VNGLLWRTTGQLVTEKEKSTGPKPRALSQSTNPNLSSYWMGRNVAAAAQAAGAAPFAGSARITPDWSEQNARWPDWPAAIGFALVS
jgi:hypothetical protein